MDTFKSDLEYLKITGGETFILRAIGIFRKISRKRFSKNITLIVVTNNTVEIDNDKLEIFKILNVKNV